MIKTRDEIDMMRNALSVTQEAYHEIQSHIRVGMYEYEIEALVARVFRAHHMIEAYPTIVASGPNACTLHYTEHTRQIEE